MQQTSCHYNLLSLVLFFFPFLCFFIFFPTSSPSIFLNSRPVIPITTRRQTSMTKYAITTVPSPNHFLLPITANIATKLRMQMQIRQTMPLTAPTRAHFVYRGEKFYRLFISSTITELSEVKKLRRIRKYTSRILSNVQINDEQFCISAIEAPILISRS